MSSYRAIVWIERDDFVLAYRDSSPFFEHGFELESWLHDVGSCFESGDLPLKEDHDFGDDEDDE